MNSLDVSGVVRIHIHGSKFPTQCFIQAFNQYILAHAIKNAKTPTDMNLGIESYHKSFVANPFTIWSDFPVLQFL